MKKTINISCFGAVRPLKNHLLQAVAAIHFADQNGLHLKFHINSTRKELGGDPILKNIVKLFEHSHHELVMVDWLDHGDFLKYIKANIDIGMQVSFTETYNIVAADHVWLDVPVVTSDEVPFVHPWFYADPTDYADMVRKLNFVWRFRKLGIQRLNKCRLVRLNASTALVWAKAFDNISFNPEK